MKILKDKEFKSQIVRYILISVLGYTYIFLSLYLLVSIIKIDKSFAFMIVYGIQYLSLYIIQLKYLFKTTHHNVKFIRFLISLIVFYIAANLLFNFFVTLKIYYLISTMIIVIILTPIRFLALKHFVYKK